MHIKVTSLFTDMWMKTTVNRLATRISHIPNMEQHSVVFRIFFLAKLQQYFVYLYRLLDYRVKFDMIEPAHSTFVCNSFILFLVFLHMFGIYHIILW